VTRLASASSPAMSETPTPEPGLCLPALPPVYPADHPSTLSPARPSTVEGGRQVQAAAFDESPRPKRSPFKTRPFWAPRPLGDVDTPSATLDTAATAFLLTVGEKVEGDATVKRGSPQPARQDGFGCTGSPRGTRKRGPATRDQPPLAEGVFVFDVFGEDKDDGDTDSRGRRPAKRPARVALPR
jgi:hypothetical protein